MFIIYSFISGRLGFSLVFVYCVMLQWMWECRCIFKIGILFPLDKCTEVELLDHMLLCFKFFEEPPCCFCKVGFLLISYHIVNNGSGKSQPSYFKKNKICSLSQLPFCVCICVWETESIFCHFEDLERLTGTLRLLRLFEVGHQWP